MGFHDTRYADTITNLIQASESKLNNPYYKFSDKKPTTVTYYKQNIKKSTLDCASKLQYAHVSSQSALRYNKILEFYLYGIGQITLDYDVGDNGVESSAISGDAVVLPNTIEPLPGDFFSINYIKEDVLFKVDSVTPDTLDTGATLYKIEYHLELTDQSKKIDEQVVDTFKFIANNVGTEFNCLISEVKFDLIEKLEDLCDKLSMYFNSIFFKSKVQAHVFKKDGVYNFYDPFMIEFIRRNKLIPGYYMHHTTLDVTFPYEYDRTLFASLENCDKSNILPANHATAEIITDINSLFVARLEDYYEVKYIDNTKHKTVFNIFDKSIIDAINSNKKFGDTDNRTIFNILISYMNNETDYIDDGIINQIHKFDYTDNQTTFYLIPMYIFIIRKYINSNLL